MHEDDSFEEEIILSKFALMIKDIELPDGNVQTRIISDGDMDFAKVILLVEGWVEKQRQRYKDHFLGGFDEGGSNPDSED